MQAAMRGRRGAAKRIGGQRVCLGGKKGERTIGL
jgi:hypothetical protein